MGIGAAAVDLRPNKLTVYCFCGFGVGTERERFDDGMWNSE
jgi:hypothetical protein